MAPALAGHHEGPCLCRLYCAYTMLTVLLCLCRYNQLLSEVQRSLLSVQSACAGLSVLDREGEAALAALASNQVRTHALILCTTPPHLAMLACIQTMSAVQHTMLP